MNNKWSVPLGRWFGIPIYLHWSWVILFLLMLFVSPSFAGVYAGLFFLVLLHELGHCLVARHFGAPTHNITLWPFGGVASIQIPFEPKQEFFVALGGPVVNVALIPVFLLLRDYNFCNLLGYYNIVLLVFNMIPAFPMDGGRVFRSLLSLFLKDHYKATLIAARTGQVICVGFAILGVYFGAFMLVVIAFFIFMAAESELKAAKICSLATVVTGETYNNHLEAIKAIERRLLAIQQEETEEMEVDG